MTRVTIDDLEDGKEISEEEMKTVFGGDRGSPMLSAETSRVFSNDMLYSPGSGSSFNQGTSPVRSTQSPGHRDY